MMIEPHPHELELLDFVENELPKERRRAVGAHVDSCSACRAAVAELEGARSTLRAAPELELPAERRARIGAALAHGGPERPARSPRRRPLAVLAGVAVLVAVVAGVVSLTGDRDDSPVGGEAAAPQVQDPAGEAAGGGEETAPAEGEGAQEDSRSSAPLAAGPVATVRGPAAEVAALLRDRGFDARVADRVVVVRGAEPRAVVGALAGRDRGAVVVEVRAE